RLRVSSSIRVLCAFTQSASVVFASLSARWSAWARIASACAFGRTTIPSSSATTTSPGATVTPPHTTGTSMSPGVFRTPGIGITPLAKAAMSMRSLRHFEEEPGAPRALDRGEEAPVGERRVDDREREPGGDRGAELRREAEVRAVRVEEVCERDRRGNGRDGLRQDRDRVVEPGEHEDEVHARPREGLGPVAEERDQ